MKGVNRSAEMLSLRPEQVFHHRLTLFGSFIQSKSLGAREPPSEFHETRVAFVFFRDNDIEMPLRTMPAIKHGDQFPLFDLREAPGEGEIKRDSFPIQHTFTPRKHITRESDSRASKRPILAVFLQMIRHRIVAGLPENHLVMNEILRRVRKGLRLQIPGRHHWDIHRPPNRQTHKT